MVLFPAVPEPEGRGWIPRVGTRNRRPLRAQVPETGARYHYPVSGYLDPAQVLGSDQGARDCSLVPRHRNRGKYSARWAGLGSGASVSELEVRSKSPEP